MATNASKDSEYKAKKAQYTAKILFQNKQVATRSSDDLTKLIAKVLSLMEGGEKFANANAVIVDNNTGKVVQECTRSSIC